MGARLVGLCALVEFYVAEVFLLDQVELDGLADDAIHQILRAFDGQVQHLGVVFLDCKDIGAPDAQLGPLCILGGLHDLRPLRQILQTPQPKHHDRHMHGLQRHQQIPILLLYLHSNLVLIHIPNRINQRHVDEMSVASLPHWRARVLHNLHRLLLTHRRIRFLNQGLRILLDETLAVLVLFVEVVVELLGVESLLPVVLLEGLLVEECVVDGRIVEFGQHVLLAAVEVVVGHQECLAVDGGLLLPVALCMGVHGQHQNNNEQHPNLWQLKKNSPINK